MYINGQWLQTANRFAVFNPANGKEVGQVPDGDADDARRAIDAAVAAFPGWAAATAYERSAKLYRAYELMLTKRDDLARLMTAEQGKPLRMALAEVRYAADFLLWFAEEAKRVYGESIPSARADQRFLVRREPVGVVCAITPWNYPVSMITRKVAPALAAGCTIVLKPAESTPLCAMAVFRILEEAGIPAGVANLVTARDPQPVGEVFCTDPRVRKLSFTGSTEVGRALYQSAAGQFQRVSLELGGHAPFIVFDDADLDAAVQGLMASKYRNTGQTCVCANRVYVQDGVYEAFAAKLAVAVAGLRVGDGLAGPTDQGPLIDERALAKVQAHIADAVSQGARIAAGGKPHALGGTFFEPTILLDVTPGMRVSREETFGPVAPLFRFHNEAEAIQLANDTEFGLAAYFFTRDLARSWRVQEALEYGLVGVNTGLISTEVAPFGGMKESGLGREGSRYGIDEYTEMKYVCVGGLGG